MADVNARIMALVQKVAKEQNMENPQIEITPISSGGANYTSTLYVATILSDNKDYIDLFIKVAAMGDKMRNLGNFKIYEIENYIYTELKAKFRHLEDKHGIAEKDRLKMCKYYAATTVPNEEIILLENLASQGFTTHDRMQSVDWDYAAASVRELSKLHALSIALDDEDPQEFQRLIKYFHFETSNITKKDSGMDIYFEGNKNVTLKAVREENHDRLKKFLDGMNIVDFWNSINPINRAVFSHGDFRSSNLMHRRQQDGSVEVIPVDYQTLRAGCPVVDLLYFIFTGTDKKFRAQYYDMLIDYYYIELCAALIRFGMNPDEKYSRKDFDDELKEKLPFGLGVAVFTLPIVTVEAENAPTVDENMDMSAFCIQKTGDLFPERLNGVVDDFVRWGVI